MLRANQNYADKMNFSCESLSTQDELQLSQYNHIQKMQALQASQAKQMPIIQNPIVLQQQPLIYQPIAQSPMVQTQNFIPPQQVQMIKEQSLQNILKAQIFRINCANTTQIQPQSNFQQNLHQNLQLNIQQSNQNIDISKNVKVLEQNTLAPSKNETPQISQVESKPAETPQEIVKKGSLYNMVLKAQPVSVTKKINKGTSKVTGEYSQLSQEIKDVVDTTPTPSVKQKEGLLECCYCNYSTMKKDNFNKHKNYRHSPYDYHCAVDGCTKICRNRQSFTLHLRKVHKIHQNNRFNMKNYKEGIKLV